jgi:hypothetical protein
MYEGACASLTIAACVRSRWALFDPTGCSPPPHKPSLRCSDLCNEVGSAAGSEGNCVGVNAVYRTNTGCLAMCAAFPNGLLADTMGDTLGCRIYHGGPPSQVEPAIHCAHAGPFGGGVCAPSTVAGGTNLACQAFCEIEAAICPMNYARASACIADCESYMVSNTAASPNPVTAAGPASGNTFECRAYHLTAAADAPALHCPHTLPSSATCQ